MRATVSDAAPAHDDGRLFRYEVRRPREDLDRHNEDPLLHESLDNLDDYLEEPPDGCFNAMIGPYAA